MDDKAWKQLDIASRIAPGLISWPTGEDGQFVHWTRLRNTVEEARSRLTSYRETVDEIMQDPRLSETGKKEQRRLAALKALAAFSGSKSLTRTQQSVSELMDKWEAKVAAAVKPAANESEAVLHGEIRRHVASLKGERERMTFVEKHGADPRVASALLEAPQFLSGIGNAEIALVKNRIEANVLDPEIVQAKVAVTKAMTEAKHGWDRAQALIAEDAGLKRAADGSWNQPEEAKADAA